MVVVYLQLALPDCPLEFLMSDSNHEDTFASLDQLRDNLVEEVIQHIDAMETKPAHIRSVFIVYVQGSLLLLRYLRKLCCTRFRLSAVSRLSILF